jgi:SAM-dependent methyltransferase
VDDHGVGLAPRLEGLLACPRCHGPLARTADMFRCRHAPCGFQASLVDGIVNVAGAGVSSFFDSKVPVMLHGADDPGSHAVFYAEQARAVEEALPEAGVIVDVGCGPRLMYTPPPTATVIGVDLSYESLRYNKDVHLRIFGTATALPLLRASVDTVVCFYLLHHLVARSRAETSGVLVGALREFGRVLRPGGRLLVFEVSPWAPVWALQRVGWDTAKRLLGPKLDMFFWARSHLLRIAGEALAGAEVTHHTFRAARWTMFPPVFALPRLRIPRALYPFDICMYCWRIPREGVVT